MGKNGDLSRREKVKRLTEATTMSSDVEDVGHTRRKYKLRKKILCDSASVPRKLRSAISKRTCQFASVPVFDPKRLKHSRNGVEPIGKDGWKKSRTSMTSSGQAVSLPITKEEEEVAETLFALAGMIPLNSESSKSETRGSARDSQAASSSEDPVISKEENGSRTSSDATNVIPAADGFKQDSFQANSLNETTLSWPKLSERRQLNQDLKVSVPPMQLQRIPPLLRACDDKQLAKSATVSQMLIPPVSQRGFSKTKPEKVVLPKSQSPHRVDSLALDTVSSQEREHDTSLEKGDNGLTSRSMRGFGLDGLLKPSSTTCFPAWVNATASSSRSGTCGDSVSVDKVPNSVNGSKRKRCITHVYISNLIQGIQMSEGKANQSSDACQLGTSQCSSIAAERNDLRQNFNSHTFGFTMNPVHQGGKDEGFKIQSFDFLSLSTGVGPRVNSGVKMLGTSSEAKGQVPHLHSASQASASLPCSNPQNYYSFKARRDQVAVASMALPPMPPQVHLQMPQYFANNAFGGAYMSHKGAPKSASHAHPMSLQQQQQQIWNTQLAAQFRPGALLSSHNANWQNRRQDPRTSTQHIESPPPLSQPSLEMIGAKYLQISQQQQQLIGRCPPLPLSSANPHSGQLPSVCEDKGSHFRPDGLRPFQLLCNERS